MNEPHYILTDEMESVVAAVKTLLGLSVLNYQYGYIKELNETLAQYEQDPARSNIKFPLVWLAEPFTTDTKNDLGIYGIADPDIFIINATDKTWKAKERMDNNYKPILYPICSALLDQFTTNQVFSHITVDDIPKKITKGYYWGENQKLVLNDAVDCLKIGSLKLRISNKQNCTIFSNI